MSNQTTDEQTDLDHKIDETKQRIILLAKKLNKYVQANGCSPDLKKKAKSKLVSD